VQIKTQTWKVGNKGKGKEETRSGNENRREGRKEVEKRKENYRKPQRTE
jgi:hypothetical protein